LRIGLFGGAFNPPHLGHLACAQEAHTQLDLDVVVWVPVGQAPHREIPQDPGREVRFQMCDYATAADERFGLTRIEIDCEGPSYTADTLRKLRERSPEDELVLLLGGDQAAALATWHRPDEVMRLATIAVAERGAVDRRRVEEAIGGETELTFFDMPRIDVSSTMVRERAASGQPIRYLVPDKVASFIGAQSLYGASVPS
jgi:nicotinate-nucleotide adenylyltransferase